MVMNFVIFCLLSVKTMHVITVQYKSRIMYNYVNDAKLNQLISIH